MRIKDDGDDIDRLNQPNEEEITIKQIHKLIGRKVDYKFFKNDVETKHLTLSVGSVNIYDEVICLHMVLDKDDETILLSDKEFEDFLAGKTYGYAFGDFTNRFEKLFKLIPENTEEKDDK